MLINPKGHIVHSMSEYIERSGLKYNRRFKDGLFNGKPIEDFPEWIHCSEYLPLIGLSVHGFVLPNGDWLKGTEPPEKALHAGLSVWDNLKFLNGHFLGFEVVVPGKNNYGEFLNKINGENWVSDSQLATSIDKSLEWMRKFNYSPDSVLRHSDVSGDELRGRGLGKKDPGRTFPWEVFKFEIERRSTDV